MSDRREPPRANKQSAAIKHNRAKAEIRIGFGDKRAKTPLLWLFEDPYYMLMDIRWPAFAGAVTLMFLLINMTFGAVYALLPGTVANAGRHSLADGFFFSVQTLATVGYGNMYPGSRLGEAISSVEILLGLFFAATVTGLIFARFARPRKGIVFSRCAVVGRHEGKRALMVRVVWTRPHPLLDATAQLGWMELAIQGDGQTLRRFRELPLLRNHNPMLGLGWTFIHILPEESDILATLERGEPLLLTASIIGTDMLLSSPTQALQRYWQGDVHLDHEFAEMVFEDDDGLSLDFSRLNLIQPIKSD